MFISSRIVCVVVCALLLTGCIEEYAARSVIRAPNRGGESFPKTVYQWHLIDWSRFIDVGPPAAQIAFRVIEPKEIRVWTSVEDALESAPDDEEWLLLQWHIGDGPGPEWRTCIVFPNPEHPGYASHRRPMTGTVIVLLGYGGSWHVDGFYMLGVAAFLADAGYRVVLPDLRGHGDSTGGTLGFGIFESHDLSQLLDAFERRGLLQGPVGIVGHSYGAGVAIQTAARDPRVDGVIAMGPWTSVREFAFKDAHAAVSQEFPLLHRLFGWAITEGMITRTVDRAGVLGGFDPDEADNVRALTRTSTPVLLIAAELDENCPVSMAEALYAARPEGTELVIYDGEDHWSYLTRRFDDVRSRCIAWLDRHLVAPTEREKITP